MNILKRYLSRWKAVLLDTLTGIGLIWLFVEILSHSTDGATDTYTKSVKLFLFLISLTYLVSLLKNKPKNTISHSLRGRDSVIEVKVGDAFKNKGSLIIPFNDYFDVSLGGNVKKAKSLQNKLISDYYSGKDDHLETDINKTLQSSDAPFDIGKTVSIEQKGKTFHLLVNSKKSPNNRVTSSIDDFLLCLSEVWEHIALETSRQNVVTIPLISTQHGRITNINRETALKEIIDSYIQSSKYLNITNKLIISILPDDLETGKIDLDEIDEYLKFVCKNYKQTQYSENAEGLGTPIGIDR